MTPSKPSSASSPGLDQGPPQRNWRAHLPVLAAIALVLGIYYATFVAEHGFEPSRKPDGYYGLLTDALLDGHLHLKVEPDPRLAKLANPWLSYQGIPRLHDATYFHGHYYLYFGVAPVFLYFMPVHWLTGGFAHEGSAAIVFATIGFIAGLAILRRMVRSAGSAPGPAWQALGVLVWGLATYTLVDSQSATFYTVPILSAFGCVTVALALAARSTQARTANTACLLLAGASLSWGLAVASRPHFVLSLPLLVIALAYTLVQGHGKLPRSSWLKLIAATALPAAAIGAALAWYNYARFGSVTEFGFRYQFTGGDQRFIKMWNPQLILPNLRWYSLSDAVYVGYFPFILQRYSMVGFLAWSPFALLAAAFPFSLASRRLRTDSYWVVAGTCALLAGAIHLAGLCILPIGVDRYLADFLPEFTLAALGSVIALASCRQSLPKRLSGAARVLVPVLALASIGKLSLLTLARISNATLADRLAVAANAPIGHLQEMLGGLKGPAQLRVTFTPIPAATRIPIVTIGMGRDRLMAEGLGGNRMRLSFEHSGNQPLLGSTFSIVPGETHTLLVDLGGFYPPNSHPYFRQWDPDVADALHHRVMATLDGKCVLLGNSDFYPTGLFTTEFGAAASDEPPAAAAGVRVLSVERKDVPSSAEVTSSGWTGPVRLHLKFPDFDFAKGEPLLSTGSARAADMIYVTYLGVGRARFGHDSTNGGGVETAEVAFDPKAEHTLDIGLGPLEAPENTIPPATPGLRLRFDGHWLIAMARPTHPTHPYQVVFGYNSGRLSTAQEAFSGPLIVPEHIEALVPGERVLMGDGPLAAAIRFVPMPSGINEPLVVTGVPGKGDIVFVNYYDSNHIRIGVDHWAVGMVLSDPLQITPNTVYTITVSSATFLPGKGSPAWHGVPSRNQDELLSSIRISVDGKQVLEAPWVGYPASDSQMNVGLNPIGGSTCGPRFSGTVLEAHRTGVPRTR